MHLHQAAFVILGILTLATIAALYVAAAWVVAHRYGSRALVGAWLVATLAYASFGLWRSHQAATLAGVAPNPRGQSVAFFIFLALGAPAFAAASIVVHHKLKAARLTGLTTWTMLLGVGAFFAGLAVVFLAVVTFDLSRLWKP